MLTDFKNSFTGRFNGKFATNMFKYPTTHDIMSLHYHVKYECQKTGVDLKYVLSLMINHKIAQLSILVVMNYFVTNLQFNLHVKEFL